MRRAWRWLVILGVAGAALWLWPKLDKPGSPSAVEDPAPAAPVGPSDSTGRAQAERSGSGPIGTLVVKAKDGDRRVTGEVLWATGVDSLVVMRTLRPNPDQSLPAGVTRVELDSEARLTILGGQWTWLCVQAGAPGYASAFARVPPFDGTSEVVVELAGGHRIHVLALKDGLATPAAHQEITLYLSDLEAGTPLRRGASVTTDAHGYGVFDGVPAGTALVGAPGATLQDRPPHVQRMVLTPDVAHRELACTVVAPPERHFVKLAVRAEVHAALGQAMLFLRGRAEREGQLYPFSAPLREGDQELEVQVPAGVYSLDALPLGALEMAPPLDLLHVPGPETDALQVHVRQLPLTTRVVLRGMTPDDFPLRVYAHPVGYAFGGSEDLLFVGPWTWHMGSMDVAPFRERAQIVVLARRWPFLSRTEIELFGREVAVDLVPATRLIVRWQSTDLHRSATHVFEIEHRGKREILLPQPMLVGDSGDVQRVIGGGAVVARGKVTVRCIERDSGTERWSRTVEANAGHVMVTVID